MELKKLGRRRTVALAGAVLSAGIVGSIAATPAEAAGRLTLTDQAGRWSLSGSGFSSGRSDVQVWVMRANTWTTLEYQSGVTTTRPVFTLSYYLPGGLMSAKGRQYWFQGSGIIGSHWANQNPLLCGQPYQGVAYDPVYGYSYSNVVTTPCPVLH